jgi:uncharacterized membrane protein YGL010W
MCVYAAYHQDARNKATHFLGVPVIVLSLMIPRVEVGGFPVTAAMLFAGVVLAYYFVLDVPLALAMLAVNAVLLWLGQWLAAQGAVAGWAWFVILFVGGWVLQLVGHVFEGRKPALVDNLFQIFIAPLFLAAEVFFALGYKPRLHAAVQERALKMRSAAPDATLTPAS